MNFALPPKFPTRKGARTSLFVPELRLFLLAAKENNNAPAALLLYRLAD